MILIKLKGISCEENLVGQMRLISFKNVKGMYVDKFIKSSTISNKGRLKDFLANNGYPLDKLTNENLANIQTILCKNDAPMIVLVKQLGFHEFSYLSSTGEVWVEKNNLKMLHPDIKNSMVKNITK